MKLFFNELNLKRAVVIDHREHRKHKEGRKKFNPVILIVIDHNVIDLGAFTTRVIILSTSVSFKIVWVWDVMFWPL